MATLRVPLRLPFGKLVAFVATKSSVVVLSRRPITTLPTTPDAPPSSSFRVPSLGVILPSNCGEQKIKSFELRMTQRKRDIERVVNMTIKLTTCDEEQRIYKDQRQEEWCEYLISSIT
jgi:hypothetical protein